MRELINKLNTKEEEVSELKTQLEKFVSQQTAQIEVPPKDKGIKNLFKFGSKK